MKIDTEFPYNDYAGYIVKNKENRQMICLVHKVTKERTTTAYARYKMAVKEKRILFDYEQVDHIDDDKTNDNIDNLQILSRTINNTKSRKSRNVTRKTIKFKCPGCGLIYEKPFNKSHLQKNGKFTACSVTCVHIVLKKGLSSEELKEIGNTQILEKFNKHSY